MKSHRAIWTLAAVSVAMALAAYGVREIVGGALGEPSVRGERNRVVAEMIAALDYDPRLRRPETQRLVERAATYCADPGLATAETCYASGLRKYYGDFDTAGARAAFERARAMRPKWAWPVNGLAIVEFVSGQRDDAMNLFKEAIRLDPEWSRPYADLAILFRRAGDVAEALEYAQKALKVEPDHPINHYNYGVILDGLGRHMEARAEYEKTIAIAPELPQAHYNLACSYGREGDLKRALGPLERAIALEPEFTEDASTDPDFDLIRDDPRFAQVAGTPGAA